MGAVLGVLGVGWKLGSRRRQVSVLGVWRGVWLWLLSLVVVVQGASLSRAGRPCFLMCGSLSGLRLWFCGGPVVPPCSRCSAPSPKSCLELCSEIGLCAFSLLVRRIFLIFLSALFTGVSLSERCLRVRDGLCGRWNCEWCPSAWGS